METKVFKHNSKLDLNTPISTGNIKKAKSVMSKRSHGKVTVNHGKSRLVSPNRRIFERLHSFRRKFVADIDFDSINADCFRLNNNVCFKRLEFPTAIVQVFSKSILVILRANQEIRGLHIKESMAKSEILIKDIISKLPKEIRIKNSELVQIHNAFVNHPTAKHNVTVKINDEVRLISDNSKGNPEFEVVNPLFALSDSEILEKFNEDLINNNPDLPSVQDRKINDVVNILHEFATEFKVHSKVQHKQMDNMDKMSNALDKIDTSINNLNSSISNLESSSSSLPRTFSKYDLERKERIKKLKQEWGW
jgi:hypothetical protein